MKLCALFASIALAAAASPSTAAWLANGPGGGQINAVDGAAGKLYVGTLDGVYTSADEGANWSRLGDLPRGLSVTSVAVDPGNPSRILATTALVLYRSTDGGAHWVATSEVPRRVTFHPTAPFSAVATDVFSNTRVSSDGGASWTDATVAGGSASFRAGVAVADAAHANTFYALDGSRGLHRSANGGSSWTALTTPSQPSQSGSPLAIDPASGDNLVWADGQLDVAYMRRYVPSTNTPSSSGTANLEIVRSLLADPLVTGRFWLTGVGGPTYRLSLYESTDHGVNWNNIAEGPASVLYASRTSAGVLYGDGPGGFMRSVDAGRTWLLRTNGLSIAAVESVSIHPARAGEMLAAGAGFGVSLSTDGGVTWTAATQGLTRNAVKGLARSPQNPDVVYAGTDDGLFRSDDGGRIWQSILIQSYPLGGAKTFGQIGIDRDDPNKLYALSGYSRLLWSDDGGVNWRNAQTTTGAYDLRFVPRVAAGTRNVYALEFVSAFHYRLYRASAHGAALAPAPAMAMANPIFTLAVNSANDRELIALSHQGTSSSLWTAYRSTDGGDTWQARGSLPVMSSSGYGAQLRFDACDSRIVYALVGRSFYVSTNQGATWTEDPLAVPLASARPINDLDVSCQGGMASVIAASFTGTQVRVPQAVEGIFGDAF